MKYKNLGNAVEFIGKSGRAYVAAHGATIEFDETDHTAIAGLKTWEKIPEHPPTKKDGNKK